MKKRDFNETGVAALGSDLKHWFHANFRFASSFVKTYIFTAQSLLIVMTPPLVSLRGMNLAKWKKTHLQTYVFISGSFCESASVTERVKKIISLYKTQNHFNQHSSVISHG